MNKLTENDKYTQLVTWNNTERDYSRSTCIHMFFKEQVLKNPDVDCLIFKDIHLTYGETDEISNRLARFLQKKGAVANSFIAVSMEKSHEMIISVLAVLKAGAAYVPIDPSYPESRINYILNDADIPLIIDDAFLRDHKESIERESSAPIFNTTKPDDLAYLIYTSGSTGKPKGVMITHQNAANLICWHNRVYDVTGKDRATQVANFSFDASVWEIWPYLAAGASLYLVQADIVLSPVELQKFFIQNRITIGFLPTPLAEKFITLPWSESSLRYLLTGGDKLHIYPSSELPFTLVNNYGPTESSVVTTFGTVPISSSESTKKQPSIGRPVDNTKVYILDKNMNLITAGQPGELYIAGHGIAKGYLNKKELTERRFIPNPFENKRGYERLYKTGDLASWNPDGTIDFRGRADHQVKIRGYRIELGEIESAIIQFSPVEKVVAAAVENRNKQKQLVAYLTVKVKQTLITEELRKFLKSKIPDYMIPVHFITVDHFSLTQHGKIDINKLPKPDAPVVKETEGILPRTDLEKKIARIWGEVLEIDHKTINIHTKFPELGGDSISMMTVIAKLNQIGIHTGSFRNLHKKDIAQLTLQSPNKPPVHIEQGPISGNIPLSAVERWFFQQHLKNPHIYNMSFELQLNRNDQEIKPEIFRRSWQYLHHQHDNLRSRFVEKSTRWEKITDLPNEESENFIFETHREYLPEKIEQIQAALNIETGPAAALILFNTAHEEPRLFITVHHLLLDGVSWRILIEDLFTIYNQLLQEGKAILPKKSSSFSSWTDKIITYSNGDVSKEEISYWTQLKNKNISPLKKDFQHNREEQTVKNSQKITISLSPEDSEALAGRVPPFFYAEINDILIYALFEAFECDNLLLNMEGHGREYQVENVDITRTVGWFTTIFPVHLEKQHENRIKKIAYVRETLQQIPNKGIGFGLLKYLCAEENVRREMEELPQAQVCFNYLGKFNLPVPGNFSFTRDENNLDPYLIDVLGMFTGKEISFDFTYCGKAFHDDRIQRLAKRFKASLKMLIQESNREMECFTI